MNTAEITALIGYLEVGAPRDSMGPNAGMASALMAQAAAALVELQERVNKLEAELEYAIKRTAEEILADRALTRALAFAEFQPALESARKDAERLDWMANNYAYVMGYLRGGGGGMSQIHDQTGTGNLRAAIDSARGRK